jgi:hypothetical protein
MNQSSKKRELDKVIDQLLAVIPETEKGLRKDLSDKKASVMYASPEMQGYWWRETAIVLQVHIGLPDVGWKQTVVGIWTNETRTETA